MRLKGTAKVLPAVGATGPFSYAALTLSAATAANRRAALLFVACVGPLAGTLLYLPSAAQAMTADTSDRNVAQL